MTLVTLIWALSLMGLILMSDYYGIGFNAVIGQKFNMTLNDVIEYGYDLGLRDYPIYDESRRVWLNNMIIDHYRFREIGFETPTMFIYYLNREMNDNMGAINPIFKMLDSDSDALFSNFDFHSENSVKSEDSESVSQTSTTSTNSNGTSESYSSTNPRQTMVGRETDEFYDAGTRAVTKSDGSSNADGSTSKKSDGSTTGTSRSYGRSGVSVSSAMSEWATGVNNALQLVYTVCDRCFCRLYSDHYNAF